MTVQNLIDILSTIENRDVEIEKYDISEENDPDPDIIGYKFSDGSYNWLIECAIDSKDAIKFVIK